MANGRLTALQVGRTHRAGGRATLCDGDGLYFRKQTPGGASWTLRYRHAGREKWFALGNYPDMSLAEAREEGRSARVKLDKGIDPMAEKRARLAAARGQKSFRQLAEDWYSAEIKGQVEHPQVARRHLDKYMLPALGSTPAVEISAHDVSRMLDRVRAEHPTAANDLLRYTKRVLDFGVRRHILRVNAAYMLSSKDAGGKEEPRTRALSEVEVKTLLKKICESDSFGEPNSLAVKLLLCLCVRKAELLAAQWNEFELDRPTKKGGPVWRLPGTRTKTGNGVDIPLAPTVVSWLRRLRVLASNSEYVFPRRRHARQSRYPHVGLDTLNAALSELDHGLKPFTVHDLRRTARTMLARQGTNLEVAERCLGHKVRGVVGTYDTHDYFDERREALTTLADSICDLANEAPPRKPRSSASPERQRRSFNSART